ncbi:hypothetical protein [Corynebacterium pilosum]|nr:hypothetical protein [Corynebacterium pilosum]
MNQPAIQFRDLPANEQVAMLKVHILDLKASQFAPPHPRHSQHQD